MATTTVEAVDWQNFEGQDCFAAHELLGLQSLFDALAVGDAMVRVDLLADALATCPMAERLLERAAPSRDTLTAQEVVIALGALGANASAPQKLRALFDAYDLDGDGIADAADAFAMLKLFQRGVLADDMLRSIAKEMVGERGLSFDAFAERFAVEDVVFGMQLGVLPVRPSPPTAQTLPTASAAGPSPRITEARAETSILRSST